MARLIRTNGKTEHVVPQDAKAGLTLREMYKLIGCDLIEIVRIQDPECANCESSHFHALIVDESGVIYGKPVNGPATKLYRGTPPRHQEFIAGDVLVVRMLNVGMDEEKII